MENVKPLILIICDYYLPGFESGGAMRTLVNMVERLSDAYDFRIITRDHDGPFNKTSYTNVQINEWNRVEHADVFYLSKDKIRIQNISRLIREVAPDSIYLSSFFSPLTVFTLLLQRLGKVNVPIVLAPEGELVPGGMKFKIHKKQLYIWTAKLLNLLNKVIWKVASGYEREYVEGIFGTNNTIFIAPNMPPLMINENFELSLKPEKKIGQANMAFVSRFGPKKNFKWLLHHLSGVKGDLSIDIYGPIEDDVYWQECQEIIDTLPKNIVVEAKGPIPHEEVAETLTKYHFFVLPTLGENFGHIFIEALAAGCPLIISDRSPWRDLENKRTGWDIPLESPESWIAVINHCIEMNREDYVELSHRTREYAVDWLTDPAHEKANREVIEFALMHKRER